VRIRPLGHLLLPLSLAACGAPRAANHAQIAERDTITDRDWALVQVGGNPVPTDPGGRGPTLRLDSPATRASGSAGCNQFSGSFKLMRDSLSFGPVVSTRMACAPAAMQLEQAYLSALSAASTYRATDSTLTLSGAAGVLAEFRAK
jgi:heat shock protein HslJ